MVRGPVLIAASVLGVGALVLIVAGLIVGTEALLVALTIDIVALWFITTWRHAAVGVPEQPNGHELQAWGPRLIATRSPPDGPLANAEPVWDHPWTACDPPGGDRLRRPRR